MTTSFYDHKAERAVAGAMADKQRAEAAVTLAQAELQHVQVESARMQLADEAQRRAAARRIEARREAKIDRADRWGSVRDSARATMARLRTLVPLLIGGIAMGAPILIGWNGQLQTAREVLHLGPLAWVFPVALEGGAWWLAYLVHRAIRAGQPTGRLRAWTWVLALMAAGMNFWHGTQAYGPIGGVSLALASLLGIGLWELTAGQSTNAAAGRSAASTRLAWARRLRYPFLSWAAASIAAAHGVRADREAAWHAAWVDRFGVGPTATRWERTLGRAVLAYSRKADIQAAGKGGFVIVAGRVQRGFAAEVRVFIDAERTAVTARAERIIHEARDAVSAVGTLFGPAVLRNGFGTGFTTPEQPELTGRPAELLTKAQAAISEGTLSPNPAVKELMRMFPGFGVPTAQAVRDYFDQLSIGDQADREQGRAA